jgi:hypothetical protein
MISPLGTSGLTLFSLVISTAVQATPINPIRRLAINYVDCSVTKEAFADAVILATSAYGMDQSSTA